MRKTFSFIGTFFVSTILVLITSSILIFVCELLKSGEIPTVLKSIIITPLFTFQHQVLFFSPVTESRIPTILQNLLGILGGLACAYYIFRDSRKRVDRKIYSVLWSFLGFLFTFVGLICYLCSKNKGIFKDCPSCGSEKLSYVYPCQYCGYHFDKEFKRGSFLGIKNPTS